MNEKPFLVEGKIFNGNMMWIWSDRFLKASFEFGSLEEKILNETLESIQVVGMWYKWKSTRLRVNTVFLLCDFDKTFNLSGP